MALQTSGLQPPGTHTAVYSLIPASSVDIAAHVLGYTMESNLVLYLSGQRDGLPSSLMEYKSSWIIQKYFVLSIVSFFFFWLCLQHVEVPGPGIESEPEE